MAKPGDKAPAGEGAGDQDGGGDDPPKYLTEGDFDKKLNSALSGFKKRLEKTIESTISNVLSKSGGSGDDGEDEEEEEGEETPGKEKEKASSKGKDKELSPLERRMNKLARENKALREQVTASERAREEEKTKGKRAEERDSLRKAFQGAGVIENYIDDLVEARLAQGVVGRDEDDKIVWKKGKDEEVALDKGVAEYLKTDAGKSYLPAKPGRGSGNTAGTKNGAVGGKAKPEEISDSELTAHLLG